MIYAMSKQMYWFHRKNTSNVNRFSSDEDFVAYINKSFGLRDKVTSLRVGK